MLKWVDETRCRRRASIGAADDSASISSFCSENSSGLEENTNPMYRSRTARPEILSFITVQPIRKSSLDDKHQPSISAAFRRTKQFISQMSSSWIASPPQTHSSKEGQTQPQLTKPSNFRFSLIGHSNRASKSHEDITSLTDGNWRSENNNGPLTPELPRFKNPLKQLRKENRSRSENHIIVDLKVKEAAQPSSTNQNNPEDSNTRLLTRLDNKSTDVEEFTTPQWFRPRSPSPNRLTERQTLKQIQKKSENKKPKLFSPTQTSKMFYSPRRSASARELSTSSAEGQVSTIIASPSRFITNKRLTRSLKTGSVESAVSSSESSPEVKQKFADSDCEQTNSLSESLALEENENDDDLSLCDDGDVFCYDADTVLRNGKPTYITCS